MRRRSDSPTGDFVLCLLIFSLYSLSITGLPFVLVSSPDGVNEHPGSAEEPAADLTHPDSEADWDGFLVWDINKSEEELDPGSWHPIFESDSAAIAAESGSESEALYYSGVGKMLSAVSSGDVKLMEEAAGEIEAAAESGYPPAQSVLGFLYGMGLTRERNKAKAFLCHHVASKNQNLWITDTWPNRNTVPLQLINTKIIQQIDKAKGSQL